MPTAARAWVPPGRCWPRTTGRLWIGTEHGIYLRHADGSLRRVPVDPAYKGDRQQDLAYRGRWRRRARRHQQRPVADRCRRRGTAAVAELTGLRSHEQRARCARPPVGRHAGRRMARRGNGHGQMFTGHPLLPGGFPGRLDLADHPRSRRRVVVCRGGRRRRLSRPELGRLHPHDPCAGRSGAAWPPRRPRSSSPAATINCGWAR